MAEIHYPAGVMTPRRIGLKSKSRSRRSKKKAKNQRPRKKRYSKYNAKRITAFGHTFDSKLEFQYYCYLRFFLHVTSFKMHVRFIIMPHTKYVGKTDGKRHAIRSHSYTPDFCIYDKNGRLKRVIDIKGMNSRGTAYDHLRFDLFSKRYSVPVYTVVKRHGRFITQIWGK